MFTMEMAETLAFSGFKIITEGITGLAQLASSFINRWSCSKLRTNLTEVIISNSQYQKLLYLMGLIEFPVIKHTSVGNSSYSVIYQPIRVFDICNVIIDTME